MHESPAHLTLQRELSKSFEIEIGTISFEQLSKHLAVIINNLILNDMKRLWTILYRIDVEEETVLRILNENPIPQASQLLAEALISRQLQKIESRKNNSSGQDIPEDEKW